MLLRIEPIIDVWTRRSSFWVRATMPTIWEAGKEGPGRSASCDCARKLRALVTGPARRSPSRPSLPNPKLASLEARTHELDGVSERSVEQAADRLAERDRQLLGRIAEEASERDD